MCKKRASKIFSTFYIIIYISSKNSTLFRKLINVFYIIKIPLSCGFVILTFLPLPNPFPGETPVREHVLLYSARFPLNKMGFGDLKKKEGLSVLNAYLADKSYIEGLVYFYSFIHLEWNIFERKGGWGCTVFFIFTNSVSKQKQNYFRHVCDTLKIFLPKTSYSFKILWYAI